MINKSLLSVAVLTLGTVAIASAKSYDVVLEHAVKAGNVQLTAGEYKLKVDGSNAVFTEARTRQSVTVPVKIENGDKKYQDTEIDTAKQGEADQIKSIELGGSKTKLEFGQ